jgi:hypothetical protein
MGFNYPCDKCDYEFTLKESVQCYLIEDHSKQLKNSREALVDEVEGCDVDKVNKDMNDIY